MARIDHQARVALLTDAGRRVEDALLTVAGRRRLAHGCGNKAPGAEISGFIAPVAVGPAELK